MTPAEIANKEETKRVYILSGGPQDIEDLYLMNLDDVIGFIKTDLAEINDAEATGESYTIEVCLMTQKQIDDLPEYEF